MDFWYRRGYLAYLLLPLSWLFEALVSLRQYLYLKGILKQHCFTAPIIIVGNISVGGAGKTPLVLYLAEKFTEQGYRVGIISRGYKAKINTFPHHVGPMDDARMVGDEPYLLARQTRLPVIISPKRHLAVEALIDEHNCDLILSDDGLQHYSLARDIEIAVVDGERGLGNGFCLPAGPLREVPERLNTVDFVVSNGRESKKAHTMRLVPTQFNAYNNGETLELNAFTGKTVHAVAGIGIPERFFATLRQLKIHIIPHSFPDHHDFKEQDLHFNDDLPIIMTEKDAVKCQAFHLPNCWYLKIDTVMKDDFFEKLKSHLH